MMNLILCNDLKIISKRCSDDFMTGVVDIEIIAIFVFQSLEMTDDWLEDTEEDDGTEWVTLKNTTAEFKRVCRPVSCYYSTFQLAVEVNDVINEWFGDIEVVESDGDERVTNTPKGVSKIVQ